MKKVLITGANSYIGTSVERYITEHCPDECEFTTIDMVDGTWREKSFAGYDVVFHVAGIAHSDCIIPSIPIWLWKRQRKQNPTVQNSLSL